MKNILYIHHSGGLGGAPRSLAFLIEKLDKSKYNPIVLMIKDGPARELFEKAGACVIVDSRLGSFHGTTVSGMSLKLFIRNLLYIIPTLYFGKKIIKQAKPDLIHLNTTCLFLFAKTAKKIDKKIPVVTHIREPLLSSFFGKILRYMNYKYTDAYIAIEEYDMSKMNTKNKIAKVIYNSVDFKYYNNSIKSKLLRSELNIPEDGILFLYLARISESNGTIEFVKYINKNIKEKKFYFAIVGANDKANNIYQKSVENECKKNTNIYLINFRNDIPDIIASSDVLVCPFKRPHFSRAVIEAAAMGVPSLVSNVKGLDELVVDGETGYIYNLNEANDLAYKIQQLGYNRKLREELGANAEIRANELFDSDKNSKYVFEVYDSLLSNNRS